MWQKYRKTSSQEIRPYVLGEDDTMISVSRESSPPLLMKCAWCGEEIVDGEEVKWEDLWVHPECYEAAWETPSAYFDDIEIGSQDRPEDRE